MSEISLIMHLVVLGLVGVDLFFGGELVHRVGERWAAGFEFTLILGYLLIVLQPPAQRASRSSGDRRRFV